ncbi:MAG: hypothetical protein DBY36_03210 [Clostridiales bacterium]|nr:MAG: hypothetical protein DBY36_03210 [Clostridiales bacterium]
MISDKLFKRICQGGISFQLCRYGYFIKLYLDITKAFDSDNRNGICLTNLIPIIILVIVSVIPTGFQFKYSVKQGVDNFCLFHFQTVIGSIEFVLQFFIH